MGCSFRGLRCALRLKTQDGGLIVRQLFLTRGLLNLDGMRTNRVQWRF